MKIVYRRYASLYFIVGADTEEDVGRFAGVSLSLGRSKLGLQNELGLLEFIHCLVETLDKYFQNVVRAFNRRRPRFRRITCLRAV